MRRTINRTLVVGVTVLASIFAQAFGPLASKANAAVVDIQSFGASYGEWSARWWQWLLSIPAATNPNLAQGQVDCAQGQSGNVWFLGGAFGSGVTRSCTIPVGKALFFPMINNLAFKPTGSETLNDLRILAAGLIDTVGVLVCEIDGRGCAARLPTFRATSPSFTVIAPPQGLLPPGQLSVPGNTDPIVSDGYWILLEPLPPGTHTIHFGGTSGGFTVDVTYNLTVQ